MRSRTHGVQGQGQGTGVPPSSFSPGREERDPPSACPLTPLDA